MHHELVDTIGPRLVQLRTLARLSQAKLAAAVGVSVSAVRAWEADRNPPSRANMKALCKLFGCSPMDLGVMLAVDRIPVEETAKAIDAMVGWADAEPLAEVELAWMERVTSEWLAHPEPDEQFLKESATALLALIVHWREGSVAPIEPLAVWYQTQGQRDWFERHWGYDPYPEARATVERYLFRLVRDLRGGGSRK